MEHATYHFDKKSLIGWMIAILIPVFISSTSSIKDKDRAAEATRLQVAVHERRLYDLEKGEALILDKIDKIDASTSDTHDNMIVLMIHDGLEPPMINDRSKH